MQGHIGPVPAGMEIVEHSRKFDVYRLTRDEIADLKDAGLTFTLHVALATTCVGVFGSFLSVLLTVDAIGPKAFATFVAIELVSGAGIVVGTISAVLAWRRSTQRLAAKFGTE